MGEGDVNKCQILRDVIYRRPLINVIILKILLSPSLQSKKFIYTVAKNWLKHLSQSQ
jgi:hypothetical protein